MKKYLIAYSLLVGLCSNAQVVADPVHQFLRAGDNIFEVYYGGPNFFKNPLTANLNGGKIVSRSGIGHTGFRFENFLNTHFSIGVETAFVQGEYDVRNTVTTYDPITYEQKDSSYSETRGVTRAGVIALFSYHDSQFKNFDYYFSGGVGYQYKKYSGFNEERYVFPITFRVAAGFRYYVTPAFSLGMNLGVGQGGILNVGAGFKF
jgi:hypothetical protein